MSILDRVLNLSHYLVGILTFLGGINTVFAQLTVVSGMVGILYSSRVGLVTFGIIAMISSLVLLGSKIKRSRRGTKLGLLLVYLVLVFSAVLQGLAFGWAPLYWLPNGILSVLAGLCWLRWKILTEYIDCKAFEKHIKELQ